MKYSNNEEIMLGDHVNLGGGMTGIVVCCFEEKQSVPNFNMEEWESYTQGVMVNSPQAGLIYYQNPSIDLVLIVRDENFDLSNNRLPENL